MEELFTTKFRVISVNSKYINGNRIDKLIPPPVPPRPYPMSIHEMIGWTHSTKSNDVVSMKGKERMNRMDKRTELETPKNYNVRRKKEKNTW